MVTLLSRIFSDADEDGSGWLTVQEFYEAPYLIMSSLFFH